MDNVVNNFVKVTQEHKHIVVKGAGGLRGVQGPAGAGLEISGSVATYADLPWQLTIYDAGKAYFVQADGLLYVWTGERWPNEGDGAEFVGPQGAPGYSPQATVTKVGDTATITITDRDGTTTATVSDGTTPVIDDSLSLVSENPVQNKVVTSAINGKQATLQAGDITTSLLADESVTEQKLADGSVTTSKIGSQSVTEGIIADGAVTTDKLGWTTLCAPATETATTTMAETYTKFFRVQIYVRPIFGGHGFELGGMLDFGGTSGTATINKTAVTGLSGYYGFKTDATVPIAPNATMLYEWAGIYSSWTPGGANGADRWYGNDPTGFAVDTTGAIWLDVNTSNTRNIGSWDRQNMRYATAAHFIDH